MKGVNYLVTNKLDRLIAVVISAFFINLYILWFLTNTIISNSNILWALSVPFSLWLASRLIGAKNLSSPSITKTDFAAYAILVVLLSGITFYYLEPTIQHPTSTIGIPNKDLHDGLAAFIADHGRPPVLSSDAQSAAYIPNSHGGFWYGYPNVLHAQAALFVRAGSHVFHATWVALTGALIVHSLATFLFLKKIHRDAISAALVAGLFAVSSLRIPLGVVASIPMIFSFALVVPAIVVCIHAIERGTRVIDFVLPAIALSVVAASYSGTIAVMIGLLILYAVVLWIAKERQMFGNVFKMLTATIPLLVATLLLQYPIYWQNTFPTAVDYDPFELSQRFVPTDAPLYMIFLGASLVLYLILAIRARAFAPRNVLGHFLFVVNVGLILLAVYDAAFHSLNNIHTSEALVDAKRTGFFGGLNHQKISRLAFLQPFFSIFFVAWIFEVLAIRAVKYVLIALLMVLLVVIRVQIPLYDVLAPEVRASLYNEEATSESYLLLSHVRLITNKDIWTPEIVGALDYLKNVVTPEAKIALVDGRVWTEETVAGWGSVYVRRPLDRLSSDASERVYDFHYVLLVEPDDIANRTIQTIPKARLVYRKGNTMLYQLNPLNPSPSDLRKPYTPKTASKK